MSFNISLEIDGEDVYSANITHNLGPMAKAAGIYHCLWRGPEYGYTLARHIEPVLSAGLCLLVGRPTQMKNLEPANGWGKWRDFLPWVAELAEACRAHPEAMIRVSQ